MEIRFLFDKTYDFLISLDDISVGKINKSMGLLERYGNKIEYPHTKSIGNGVFELRVIGDKHVRIFFIYQNNTALVLHAIVKKTNGIPKKELDYIMSLKNKLR